MVPSPHIVATYVVIHTHTYLYCTFHHVDTEIHILIPCPASSRMNSCMTWCWFGFFSVAFCLVFISPVMHIWTSLFCIDLDPAAGLLKIWAFVFSLYFGARVGWVWGEGKLGLILFFLFRCRCCFSFSLVSSSSSVVHPPSKDRAAPPVFASSCAAWTFGGWKIQSSPTHQVCVYLFIFIIFFCAIWLLKKHPPPIFDTT